MIIEYNCAVGRSARELSWKRDAQKKKMVQTNDVALICLILCL